MLPSSKTKIFNDLKEAFEEVKQIHRGKKNAQSTSSFPDELKLTPSLFFEKKIKNSSIKFSSLKKEIEELVEELNKNQQSEPCPALIGI